MSAKTDKFISNVLKERNLAAKENLKSILEEKVENKVKQILQKNNSKK